MSLPPAEKDAKLGNALFAFTKQQIEQQKLAKKCYDYFYDVTSSLHMKIPFEQLPPMYIEAWMGVVKVVSTALEDNTKQSVNEVSPIVHTSCREAYMLSGEMAGLTRPQLEFFKRFFKFKKDDSLF